MILLSCAALFASCKGKGLFAKKKDKSDVTGWNYDDKNRGGYQVAKAKEQATGPGLVLVQVHLVCLTMHELPCAGKPESLFGTGVRLHLRHV